MKKWFAIAVSLALLTAVLCGCDETSPQYESGYEQGYSDGKESGYKEGLSDNKADIQNALDKGSKEGYSLGALEMYDAMSEYMDQNELETFRSENADYLAQNGIG